MLPSNDLGEIVRNPIDARQARQLLKHLAEWDGNVSSQWKVRNNRHQKAIETGDPFALAEVYKGLCRLQNETGRLRISDRKHLQTALDLLTEELAVALGRSADEAREAILKCCSVREVEVA